MKINPAAIQNLYKTNMIQSGKLSASNKDQDFFSVASLENTDRISISSQGAYQKEIGKMVKSVMKDVDQATSPERLASIKEKIQNKTYIVSSSQVADAILNRICGE